MENWKRKKIIKIYIEGQHKSIDYNNRVECAVHQVKKRILPPHEEKIKIVYAYLTRAKRIMHATTIFFYIKELEEMRDILLHHGFETWEEALNILNKRLIAFVNTILRDEEITMTEKLINEHINDLLNLNPLESFDTSGNEQDGIQNLIDAVKEDVKKGNRATFKLVQELESKLEELAFQSNQNQQEQIQMAIQEIKKQNQELINLSMEMLDQMDLIDAAVEQLGNEDIQKEIKLVLERSLVKLEEFGLEELNVKGTLIDGKTMISLGNVPREQYAPELEQYHVYSVHKRGFRDRETKELIRKATVITVN